MKRGAKFHVFLQPDESEGVKCPRCEEHAAVVASKPYCPACGWNREGVEQSLREKSSLQRPVLVIFILSVFVIGILASFGGRGDDAWIGGVLFVLIVAIAQGVQVFRARRALAEFLAGNPPAPARSVSFDEDASASAKRPASPAWELAERIRQLPVPRRVRFRWSNPAVWFILAIVAGILIVTVAVPQGKSSRRIGPFSDEDIWKLAVVLIVPVGLMAAYRGFTAQKKLLVTGVLAEARVVRQEWQTRKNHRWSQVYYEFHDLAGQRIEGNGTDQSATFFEDMRLPVLYDPQNPSKNLALCERLHFTVQV
jgi:ribosomal protein L37E